MKKFLLYEVDFLYTGICGLLVYIPANVAGVRTYTIRAIEGDEVIAIRNVEVTIR